eukprot:s374_g47.t1
MKIQLLSLICAAFGLSLPEIPDLPDVVGIVENAIHGNFTAQTVEEPQEFLPTIAEIRAMADQERAERFHWFLCVFLLVFLCVVISGTVIMVVGAEFKALGSYLALDRTAPLSKGAQLRLVMLSFGGTVLLSFAACHWSLRTGRLSKTLGLAWEVYLFLFCCAGASLLIQAGLAVAWLKAGDRFDTTAFAVASFSSMAPFLSDQFDTLKDVIFGWLCLQSQQFSMKIVGVLSWSYLLASHAWFFYLARYSRPCANCFNELATSHLSVLLIAPKVQGEWSGGCWEGIILPTIYRQVTKSKRHHLLIENVPQALMSVIFLTVEGGSFFVAALNLVIPGVQIVLTFLLFKPVRAAAIPALGKRLSRAMKSGNIVAAKALWEEAEIEGDRQLFAEILPHLTFFLDDLNMLSDEELDTLQCMAAVFAGQAECGLDHRKIGDSGAKVVAEALKSTTTEELVLSNTGCESGWRFPQLFLPVLEALAESLTSNRSLKGLWLENNHIGERGAEALAEGLKSNRSLGWLELQNNNIGDRGTEALAEGLKSNRSLGWLELESNNIGDPGAEALAESLKSNGSLRWLFLQGNNLGDRGAEALAAGLLQNRSLWRLSLSEFGSSLLGRPAGCQALEEAEKIKQERGDDFEIWWM